MKRYIEERAISEGEYIIADNCTVRTAAKYFNISKSTVHTDVTVRLKCIDYELYTKVKKVLDYNFGVRHIRGGETTRRKYTVKRGI